MRGAHDIASRPAYVTGYFSATRCDHRCMARHCEPSSRRLSGLQRSRSSHISPANRSSHKRIAAPALPHKGCRSAVFRSGGRNSPNGRVGGICEELPVDVGPRLSFEGE